MAKSRAQTNRSSITRNRPTTGTRDPGELYTNWPDKALGVIDASGAAVDLTAVRFFSTTAEYITDELVVEGGSIYRCTTPNGPGAFDIGDWQVLGEVFEAPLDGDIYGRQGGSWTETITKAIYDSDQAATAGDISALDSRLTTAETDINNSEVAIASLDSLKAPKADPVFTGNPQAPTPITSDNDTSIATTAYVKAQGYLTDAPNDGQLWGRMSGGWAEVSGGGAIFGEFRFSNVVGGVPANGTVRFNNATQNSTTQLAISDTSDLGNSVNAILSRIVAGSKIYIQDENNDAQWKEFIVTTAPVDQGTYHTIPVAFSAGGTDLVNTERVIFSLISAAGGGVTVSDTPPASPTQGSLWFESDSGNMYVWFEDGTSNQWVQLTGNLATGILPDKIVSDVADMIAQFETGPSQFVVHSEADGTSGFDALRITKNGLFQFDEVDMSFYGTGTSLVFNAESDGSGINVLTINKSGAVNAAPGKSLSFVQKQVITASGAITLHADTRAFLVEVQGGGGGGGGVGVGTTNNARAGGGGGGGGYASKWIIRPAGTYTPSCTVGTGGASSVGGLNTTFIDGIVTVVGNGGSPGDSNAPVTTFQYSAGGLGGLGSGGDVSVPGSPGGAGLSFGSGVIASAAGALGGAGGSSHLGGGGRSLGNPATGSAAQTAGVAGNAYGGGGSGATQVNAGTAANGGAGANGVVIVTEFR